MDNSARNHILVACNRGNTPLPLAIEVLAASSQATLKLTRQSTMMELFAYS